MNRKPKRHREPTPEELALSKKWDDWIRLNPHKFGAFLDEMIRRQNGLPPRPLEGPNGITDPNEPAQNSEPGEPTPE